MELARRRIVDALKEHGPSTLSELAKLLGNTTEAVRQRVRQLEGEGLVTAAVEPSRGGRPAHRYGLTRSGEHLFPKRYADLATSLLDTLGQSLGPEAVGTVLAAMVDAKVAAWRPRLEGRTELRDRLEALRGFYGEDDRWIEVVERDGETILVERNCPFLEVAHRRPALCSTTVQTLSRLLGFQVERVRRFQEGHGRCEFLVRLDQPVDPDGPFRPEPAAR